MAAIQLRNDLFWTGVYDPDLRRFDIVMETKYGSTYNSYVLKGNDKTVLIDGSKAGFEDQWLANIKGATAIEDIDYMIVQHSEPDHTSAVGALLNLNPNIVVYGSALALANLKEIVNIPFTAHVIKDNETVDIGGMTLRFIVAPNLHWPDTIFTYVEEKKYLFTCDFLGAHICPEEMLVSKQKKPHLYQEAFFVYYDAIMSPFKQFVRAGLNRIINLDFDIVLNSHGPVIDNRELINNALELYTTWSAADVKTRPLISVVYCSNYGFTKVMAEAITDVLKSYPLDVELYDIVETKEQTMVESLAKADGILVGSPTIVADVIRPVYDLLNSVNVFQVMGKTASAFGSYGWSGEAVDNLLVRLKQLKMKTPDTGIKVRLNPNATELQSVRQFADQFAHYFIK